MSWIRENTTVWRKASLLLALAAFVAPWTLELIWVPAEPEYVCRSPYIRLDEDFCGKPLPGVMVLGWMIGGFTAAGRGLATDPMGVTEWGHDLLLGVNLSLLVLPCLGTLLSILRGDRWHRRVFNIVAWSLGAGMALFIGLFDFPKMFWAIWGVGLYVGVAVTALTLESLALAAGSLPARVAHSQRRRGISCDGFG
jgi:hypothetical protein